MAIISLDIRYIPIRKITFSLISLGL
ncbi:uncharacterized protein FTOL_10279 [Fusarium torulosum]|uniref:Uncharacterized protein n=1 Tax=Fusarium torulosum TaxID=33205 RepID=A0AAE8MGK7_9HYPO|nr:uncharacterized protein FTOL_10279 [Fusarium torulosum]